MAEGVNGWYRELMERVLENERSKIREDLIEVGSQRSIPIDLEANSINVKLTEEEPVADEKTKTAPPETKSFDVPLETIRTLLDEIIPDVGRIRGLIIVYTGWALVGEPPACDVSITYTPKSAPPEAYTPVKKRRKALPATRRQSDETGPA